MGTIKRLEMRLWRKLSYGMIRFMRYDLRLQLRRVRKLQAQLYALDRSKQFGDAYARFIEEELANSQLRYLEARAKMEEMEIGHIRTFYKVQYRGHRA